MSVVKVVAMTIPETTTHTGARICRRVIVLEAVPSKALARIVTISEAVYACALGCAVARAPVTELRSSLSLVPAFPVT